ncbi:MAG TPA: hypothetical protein VM408_03795, partial [Methylomirabilota bacterium]|nr:hypothetical protein [Methylomirabilota bacterium]
IHDPLYPYGNDFWGRSPAPGEAITVATLGRQFVPRRTNSLFGGSTALGGKYVLVLPYEIDLSVWSAAR